MVDVSVQLSLFGTLHFNRQSVVRENLEEFASDADALFIEYPRPDVTTKSYWLAVLRVPAFFLGFLAMATLLQLPAFAIFNRSLRPTEACVIDEVADGRPVHTVDEYGIKILARQGLAWTVANWLLLAGLAWVWPLPTLAVAVLGIVGGIVPPVVQQSTGKRRLASALSLGILAASIATLSTLSMGVPVIVVLYLFAALGIGVIHNYRNESMLADVEAIASEEGYQRVCLATGRAHLSGMVAMADQFDFDLAAVFKCRWLRDGTRLESADFESEDETDSDSTTVSLLGATGPLSRRERVTMVVRKTVAAAIDLGVGVVLGLAVAVPVGFVLLPRMEDSTWGALGVGIILVCVLVYHAHPATRGRRTVGKRLLGLNVLSTDGALPSRKQAYGRALLFVVDLCGGFLLQFADEHARRVGDHAAATIVTQSSEALAAARAATDADPPTGTTTAAPVHTTRRGRRLYAAGQDWVERTYGPRLQEFLPSGRSETQAKSPAKSE